MSQRFNLEKEIYQRFKANQGVVWLVGEEPMRYTEAIESVVERLNDEQTERSKASGHKYLPNIELWCHDKLCGWYTGLPGLMAPDNGSANTQTALMQAIGTLEQIQAYNKDMVPPFDPAKNLIMVLNDVQDHIGKSAAIRQQIRNICQANLSSARYADDEDVQGERGRRMLVFITPTAEIRGEHGRKVDLPEITPIRVPLPESDVMHELVMEHFISLADVNTEDSGRGCPMPTTAQLEFVTESLLGLTRQGAENALSRATIANLSTDDEGNSNLDLQGLYNDVEDEKSRKCEEIQGLEYVSKRDLPDHILPGYEYVQEMVEKRLKITPSMAKAHGNFQPLSGFLLAGSYGNGKTEAAKITAKLMDRILLILNVGRVQGRYVGDSEENLERALSYAEAMGAILLLDDYDKIGSSNGGSGDTSGGGGSGVMGRMTQMLLTKSSDANSRVVYIITANRVSRIETALKRPGRLDAQFFVEMPNAETRFQILKHHIARHKLEVDDEEQLAVLASDQYTDRWSGAELAHVLVKEAAIEALGEGREVISAKSMCQMAKGRTPFAEMPSNKQDIADLESDCSEFIRIGNVKSSKSTTPPVNRSLTKRSGRVKAVLDA